MNRPGPYLCLDAHLDGDEKLAKCSPTARYLFVVLAAYCTQELTDGRVPKVLLPRIFASAGAKSRHLDELLSAGLVTRIGDEVPVSANPDDYYLPAYLTWNPSRAEREAELEHNRARQAAYREKQKLERKLRSV